MRLLLFLASLALAATAPAQGVILRFRPPVGRSFAYTAGVSMTMRVPNQPGPVAFTQTIPVTLRAVSRSGGTTVVETRTGKMRLDAPKGSPMLAAKAQVEAAVSGKTARVTVDELGNLKSVGAMAMPQGLGSGMAKGVQGVSFPSKPLRVGETWGGTVDLSKFAGGAAKASGKIPITYRLAARGNGVSTITVDMTGTMNIGVGAQAMRSATKMTGTMRVEEATGMLVSMSTTMDTTMTMGSKGTSRQHATTSMRRI